MHALALVGPVPAQVIHSRPVEPARAQGAERQVARAERGLDLERRPQVGLLEGSRLGQGKAGEDDQAGLGCARSVDQLRGVGRREAGEAFPLPAVVEQRVLPGEGDVDHGVDGGLVDQLVARGSQPLGDQRAQLGLASPEQDFQSFSNWAMSSMITVAPPTWTSTG